MVLTDCIVTTVWISYLRTYLDIRSKENTNIDSTITLKESVFLETFIPYFFSIN